MYIIRNAIRSVSRSKGRNFLIGLIVLVIAVATCIALSIREAAKTAEQSSLDGLQITAQISVDRQSMMQDFSDGDTSSADKSDMKEMLQGASSLSLDEMQTYAGADSVEDFYYTITASLNGNDDLEAIDTSSSDDESTEDNSQQFGGGMAGGMGGEGQQGGFDSSMMQGMMGNQGDFTIVGYSADTAMTDFINGTSTITDGEMFEEGTSDYTCIISDELALYNNLAVGDIITLLNPNNEDETYEIEVVGIYNNSTSTVTDSGFMKGFGSASSDPANQIYMSYNAVNAIVDYSSDNAVTETDDDGNESTTALREQVSGTYTFADIESYEAFEDEARALGLSDDYVVSSTDVSQYESSLEPIQNLSKYATYFFIVVLIIGGIILAVLNIFNIRERKYEIGVLTAIGMKKWKVGVQFITEIFCVTFIAIVLGAGFGAGVSVPVTNMLLEQQITSAEEDTLSVEGNFGRPSGAGGEMQGGNAPSMPSGNSDKGGFFGGAADYVSEVNSATNMTVILQLIGVGFILTIVSSLSAVAFVMRYDPLKILSSRD